MIQNAAARLVFNEPKRAHITPLFVSLHWLPVAARIKFKTLKNAYTGAGHIIRISSKSHLSIIYFTNSIQK